MRGLLLRLLGLGNLLELLRDLKASIDSERRDRVSSFHSLEAYSERAMERVAVLEEAERQRAKVWDYAVRFKGKNRAEMVLYFKDKLDALRLARIVSGELEYMDKNRGVRIRRDPSYGLDEFEEG